jgi:hypothetical protein
LDLGLGEERRGHDIEITCAEVRRRGGDFGEVNEQSGFVLVVQVEEDGEENTDERGDLY